MSDTPYKEGYERLDQVLVDYLREVEGDAVFLCERGGSIIAQQAIIDDSMADNVAALGAGAFFASMEIARLLGEDEFDTVSQRGKKVGLFVQAIDGEFLLLVIYGNKTNHGLVKYYAQQSINMLKKLFEDCPQLKNPVGALSDSPFELDLSKDLYRAA